MVNNFIFFTAPNNFPFYLAGIMLVPFELTGDGHESQWQVNYLSHFLLTKMLLPRLEESATEGMNSRIVNLSSSAHLGGKLNFDDLEMK